MPKDQFYKIGLLQFVWFYHTFNVPKRLKTDTFVLFSIVWKKFTESSIAYKPGVFITINEQVFLAKLDALLLSSFLQKQIDMNRSTG